MDNFSLNHKQQITESELALWLCITVSFSCCIAEGYRLVSVGRVNNIFHNILLLNEPCFNATHATRAYLDVIPLLLTYSSSREK